MRVTNAMMTQSVIWNISSNLNNMNSVYKQLASGEKYSVASESPVEASKALSYQAYLTELDQYESNISDADSWMSVTESSLESMVDIVQRVSELSVQAANDTLDDEDLEKVLSEIEELTDELIQLGNTDYAGSYIFAGYDTSEEPFEMTSTLYSDIMTYKGVPLSVEGPYSDQASDTDILAYYSTYSSESFENQDIEYPTSTLQSTHVNLDGFDVMGTGTGSAASVLSQLKMYLSGESSYKEVDTTTSPVTVVTKELDMDEIMSGIEKVLDTLVSQQTEIGSRMTRNDLKADRVATDIEMYNDLLSQTKEADIAELSVEMAEAETVYEASLAASSKVILPTLLNFL
jgi:flagellar hook-associated protein 3 FlgL